MRSLGRRLSGLEGKRFAALITAALLATPACGRAQDMAAPTPPSPKISSVQAPIDEPPLCTDRPTKSSLPCTVPAGDFQYEADVFNASHLQDGGASTDVLLIPNPTLKYGLTPKMDIEANLSPFEINRTRTVGGQQTITDGIGDLYLKLKYEFFDAPGSPFQAAIVPYLKVPTARPGIGNGAVEGGALAPISYVLSPVVTFTTSPELDDLADINGAARHINTVQVVSMAISLPRSVTLYGEVWGDWNFEPSGTIRQYSADVAASLGVTKTLQVDAGANFGLNPQTPAVQAYVGLSQRF